MPWPFRPKLSRADRDFANGVILHLQTMTAFQQLAMEIYNDAMSSAGGSAGDEVFVRGRVTLVDPDLVMRHMIPAAERKIAVIEEMQSEHASFDVPESAEIATACYALWTELIAVLLARAELQRDCFRDWIASPALGVSARSTALDLAEEASLNRAINGLNDLIEKAGLVGDPWLSINCAAFNAVRSRNGLPPLEEGEFRDRFVQGMSGGRARFFE